MTGAWVSNREMLELQMCSIKPLSTCHFALSREKPFHMRKHDVVSSNFIFCAPS